RRPGASPTIRRRESAAPQDSTGSLRQSGCSERFLARNSASRGQAEQLRGGLTSKGAIKPDSTVDEIVVDRLLMRRAPRIGVASGPFARIAADPVREAGKIDKFIGLAPQFVSNHGGLSLHSRDN